MVSSSNLFVWLLLAASLLEIVVAVGHETIVVEMSPNGLFVATSERHYAFTHPDLSEASWSSVSVRDNQVFIVREDNSTSLKRLDKLDESIRDFISDLRSDFIANLAGLSLTYLPQPKARAKHSKSGYESAGSKTMATPLRYRPIKSHTYPVAHGQSIQQLAWRGPAASVSGKSSVKSTKKVATMSMHYRDDEEVDEWQPSGSFNYYNVHQSELRKKLTGDVYHFDMSGNILDVFSSTISIRLGQPRRKTSILYRDERFFSYSSPSLPLAIHRDSTVVAKSLHMLNPEEKKLVAKVRAHVKKLSQWQSPPPGFTFALPSKDGTNSTTKLDSPDYQ